MNNTRLVWYLESNNLISPVQSGFRSERSTNDSLIRLETFILKGRLPVFIKSFLADRRMQVRVGSTLSDQFEQAQGVLQGSILSTILFNIKINNIVSCLDPKTEGSLYVDDFCICFRSKSMRTIERHLQ